MSCMKNYGNYGVGTELGFPTISETFQPGEKVWTKRERSLQIPIANKKTIDWFYRKKT